MKPSQIVVVAILLFASVDATDPTANSVEYDDPVNNPLEPEHDDAVNVDYTPYVGPHLCRGPLGGLGPCGQRRAARKCPGKCVRKPRLRQGNPADRCGIQYGCVQGCCRHSSDKQVAEALRQCTARRCTYTRPMCMAPCLCQPPDGGQWIQGVNSHQTGFCRPIRETQG
ncbi:hypothetical protein AAVH_18132 [Aphelenchoides avenae]|nr:hypothetical protein AAVH_18132 [Aphelenchus avenae]